MTDLRGAARSGPSAPKGAVPETDARTLARRVRRLELLARREVACLRRGDYRTAVRGRGLIFLENRRYVDGEPARHIDWNVTARLREPHVRVHTEERSRDVVVAVDVSPSMHAGTGRRTKLEVAVEAAAILAVSAVDAGDRAGLVTFADRVLRHRPPAGGRVGLFAVLADLLRATGPWRRSVALSDPRTVFAHLERRRRGRSVVFVVSDLVDYDLPDDLRYAHPRHDVSLLWVVDPFEAEPGPARPFGRSPEGANRRGPVATGRPRSRTETEEALRSRCTERGIAFASLSTADEPRSALLELFQGRRRGRARGRR